MKSYIYRLLGLALFFVFCYHLDSLLEVLFEHTDFFAATSPPADMSWWEQLWESGKAFIFEKIGDFIEFLLVISSKLFWPFLFAAIAVPLLLPRMFAVRNRWSATLAIILTISSVFIFSWIKDDLAVLWNSLKGLSLPDSVEIGYLAAHLKWALVIFAINVTIIYIFLYRILHKFKMEQLLYFFVLLANAFYILLPDPIIGEVDDVVGLFVTAFLSLAIFIDRIFTTTSSRPATQTSDAQQ